MSSVVFYVVLCVSSDPKFQTDVNTTIERANPVHRPNFYALPAYHTDKLRSLQIHVVINLNLSVAMLVLPLFWQRMSEAECGRIAPYGECEGAAESGEGG